MLTANEARLRRYLLGELTEDEQNRLEEALLADDEEFELLLAVEDDLIDAYVSGGLAADERQRFEQHYHSSAERWQRVELARDLRARLAQRSDSASQPAAAEPAPGGPRRLRFPTRSRPYLALAATLVLAVTTGLLGLHVSRIGNRLADLEAERRQLVVELETINRQHGDLEQNLDQERVRVEQLDRELTEKAELIADLDEQLTASSAVAAIRPLVIPFVLSPAARSTGSLRLVVPPTADSVELQIELEGEDEVTGLRARLHTVRGDEVWSRSDLDAVRSDWGSSVAIRLPAAILTDGSYVLTVESVTRETPRRELGIYDFQIRR